jgi:hypothetical protein
MTYPGNQSHDQEQVVQALLRQHSRLSEAVTAVNAVVQRVRFPVNSFQDLVDALGGPDSEIQLRPPRPISDFQSFMPPYYFPIANVNDLAAKIADVAARLPSPAPGPADVMAPSGVMEAVGTAPPSPPPPPMSAEELRAAGLAPGIAGVGGTRRAQR